MYSRGMQVLSYGQCRSHSTSERPHKLFPYREETYAFTITVATVNKKSPDMEFLSPPLSFTLPFTLTHSYRHAHARHARILVLFCRPLLVVSGKQLPILARLQLNAPRVCNSDKLLHCITTLSCRCVLCPEPPPLSCFSSCPVLTLISINENADHTIQRGPQITK